MVLLSKTLLVSSVHVVKGHFDHTNFTKFAPERAKRIGQLMGFQRAVTQHTLIAVVVMTR